MTQKGSDSRGHGERKGDLSVLDKRLRRQVLLSIWFGRENEYLRPKEIRDTMLGVCGASPSWTTRNLKRMVNDGTLETKEKRYRPSDYYVEYSPAVPIRLMERSPTFLSLPLSPYRWMTIHGFPGLEELTPDELRMLLSHLREMEELLRRLILLRAEAATRLGLPQVDENVELLKDDICAYLSQAEPGHQARPSLEDDSGSVNREGPPNDVKNVAGLSRIVWFSREWEEYVETPLVGSFCVLSHMLKAVSPGSPHETDAQNFQFFSYVLRLLEIASTLWRAHLLTEGRDEESVHGELKSRGLNREGLRKGSMEICKSAFRRMFKEQRQSLKEKREILHRILDRLQDSQTGSAELKDIESETFSLLLTRVLGSVAEGHLNEELSETVESFRTQGGTFSPALLGRIVKDLLADIDERDGKLKLIDQGLCTIDSPNQFRLVTHGCAAPSAEQLRSWELDLTGFARTHFPPGILTD